MIALGKKIEGDTWVLVIIYIIEVITNEGY